MEISGSIRASLHTLAELQGEEADATDARLRFSELRGELRKGKRCYSSPKARILESMIAVVDCDAESEEAWHRVWARWRKTMIECGWRPPSDPER